MQNELNYLNLVRKVLDEGIISSNRTGTDTISLWGESLRLDISDGKIPIITTKKVNYKAAIEEILWMLSGSTDSKKLEEKGIMIWKHNTSRMYLDSRGLDYPEGEIGPTYGFNFRNFGGNFLPKATSEVTVSSLNFVESEQIRNGVDQLSQLIEDIKSDPYSRRHILTLWNPVDVNKAALPPCVYCYQVRVIGDGLHLLVSQRSADIALGVPFNIIQGCIIANILAAECNLKPKTLQYNYGDLHAYMPHCDGLRLQLTKSPMSQPLLTFDKKEWSSYLCDDFHVQYTHHPYIKFEIF